MLQAVPASAAVKLHDSAMKIIDIETHVRRASHLARALFLLTHSDVNFSDERDRSSLDALADEIAAHTSAAEHLLDAPALN